MLLSVGVIGVWQPSAFASYAFSNSQVVAKADSYPIGYDGGQCRVWAGDVINAVLAADGISARVGGYGSPGGAYYGAYADAGGTLISASQARPGDLVQFIAAAQKNSDYPTGTLHTAIIVGMTSTPGTYVVRDSNWGHLDPSTGKWVLDGLVREHTMSPVSWAASNGVSAYFWRFGTVTPPAWHSWEELATGLTAGPGVSSWAAGRLDVFWVGHDHHLWHKWFDGSWHSPEDLGGSLQHAVSAVSWGSGRIDIFAQGTDGNLWHKWFNGAWQPWEELATGLTAGPAVSSWAAGRLDVFWAGHDNHLWHMWYDANGWHSPENLSGNIVGAVSAVSWGNSRIDIFAEGTDGNLWHKWYG